MVDVELFRGRPRSPKVPEWAWLEEGTDDVDRVRKVLRH